MSKTQENQSDSEVLEDILNTVVVDDSDPIVEDENVAEPTKAERDIALATVVNLADVPNLATPAKRGRGRPRKVNKKPTFDDLQYHAQMQVQQAGFQDNDPIVQVTRERKSSAEVLQQIKERIAVQTANLEFRRIEMNKTGKDTAQLISRQVAALKEIAAIELKIRELGSTTLDLRSEDFQKVFGLLMAKLSTVATEVLPAQQTEVLINRLESELMGWEDEAESLLR